MKKTELDKELLDAMSKDPKNWKGPFYLNSKDPRLFVCKSNNYLDWTLNLASPYSYVCLVLLISIIKVVVHYHLH